MTVPTKSQARAQRIADPRERAYFSAVETLYSDAGSKPEHDARYQALQVNSIASMDRNLLVNHIVAVAKTGVGFRLPIVHSTVNVKTGWNKPPIAPLRKVLEEYPTYDRTSINAWEDVEFRKAVEGTKRKKIIMTALWTEACLIMPTLDMLKEGYEIYVVADAVGGTSPEAHEMALRRIQEAGGRMTSVTALICELQRDWNRGNPTRRGCGTQKTTRLGMAGELQRDWTRTETLQDFTQILFDHAGGSSSVLASEMQPTGYQRRRTNASQSNARVIS